ncbi:MAG: hypothetical protein HY579_08495 [Nitrospinae bacterium]|nr:hypothetical protein [Nitrospinota bacterium]
MIRKMALAFALFSFGIVAIGSFLFGSRILTSLVRGTEAAAVFGSLAWALGLFMEEKDGEGSGSADGGEERQKGTNLDQTA